MSSRAWCLCAALAACGPDASMTDAGLEAGADVVTTPDTSAPVDAANTCSGPCASNCCNDRGRCIDLQTDLGNCGACGRRCASNEGCSGGMCFVR